MTRGLRVFAVSVAAGSVLLCTSSDGGVAPLFAPCAGGAVPSAYFSDGHELTDREEYVSDVWSVTADGSVARLTSDGRSGDAEPTADGTVITYLKREKQMVADAGQSPHELWLRHVRSGSEVKLYEGPSIHTAEPSPGGRFVVFAAVAGSADPVTNRVHLLDVRHPEDVELLTQENVQEYDPSWSPDGRQVAYVKRMPAGDITESVDEIRLVDLVTRASRSLYKPYGTRQVIGTEWSPDGTLMLVSTNGFDPDGTYRAHVTKVTTGPDVETHEESKALVRADFTSVDGDHLARFASDGDDGSQDSKPELRRFDRSGNEIGRLRLDVDHARDLAVAACGLGR